MSADSCFIGEHRSAQIYPPVYICQFMHRSCQCLREHPTGQMVKASVSVIRALGGVCLSLGCLVSQPLRGRPENQEEGSGFTAEGGRGGGVQRQSSDNIPLEMFEAACTLCVDLVYRCSCKCTCKVLYHATHVSVCLSLCTCPICV